MFELLFLTEGYNCYMKNSDQLDPKKMEKLYEAFLALKTPDECKRFLRDLCTLSELREMSERFLVADMISQKIPYREIAARTGVSTGTITRIAHWLYHGEEGYALILKRLEGD